MSRLYPSLPIVGVGAVILREGEVLIVRRANPPLQGEWSIPGGALDLGEKLRDGVAREVREETGLEVEVGPVLDVFDSIFPRARAARNITTCSWTISAIRAPELPGRATDASEVRWARPEELDGSRHEAGHHRSHPQSFRSTLNACSPGARLNACFWRKLGISEPK